jgi:hypothetical protein
MDVQFSSVVFFLLHFLARHQGAKKKLHFESYRPKYFVSRPKWSNPNNEKLIEFRLGQSIKARKSFSLPPRTIFWIPRWNGAESRPRASMMGRDNGIPSKTYCLSAVGGVFLSLFFSLFSFTRLPFDPSSSTWIGAKGLCGRSHRSLIDLYLYRLYIGNKAKEGGGGIERTILLGNDNSDTCRQTLQANSSSSFEMYFHSLCVLLHGYTIIIVLLYIYLYSISIDLFHHCFLPNLYRKLSSQNRHTHTQLIGLFDKADYAIESHRSTTPSSKGVGSPPPSTRGWWRGGGSRGRYD